RLRNMGSGGQVLYVGPHRTTRRQNVQWRNLLAQPISLGAILARNDVPGFDGISLIAGERDPWNVDDAGNYLKHGLCQIEVDRKDAIAARYDTEKEIRKDSLPDVWGPLRELTNNLLPHLEFSQIDSSNKTQLRVLWKVHNKDVVVDLDELSSGEKAI